MTEPSGTSGAGMRAHLLETAGGLLASEPYVAVTLARVADAAGCPLEDVEGVFPAMHAVGSAILDHERESMRAAQRRAGEVARDPIESLVTTFRCVGENLAGDVVVRAGVRLAAESRHYFPERRIDPFATWERFVTQELERAREESLLREDVDLPTAVWLLVAAGMGTKDLVAFRNTWEETPVRLEETVIALLALVTREGRVPRSRRHLHARGTGDAAAAERSAAGEDA